MARRRKRNRRRRRGGFAGLYKLLCFLLIIGAIVAALALFFKVETIRVTGNARYSTQTVAQASGMQQGDNLFLMNKYEVARRISAELPYVESVRITRTLPDALLIDIQECTCGAALVQDGTTWVLCSSGKIVDALEGDTAEGYAVVTGLPVTAPQVGTVIAAAEEENETACEQLKILLAQLRSKNMLGDVQEIHLENSEYITLRYLDRFDVEIPWDADFDYKLNFLTAVVEKLEDYETGTLKMMKDGEARLISG